PLCGRHRSAHHIEERRCGQGRRQSGSGALSRRRPHAVGPGGSRRPAHVSGQSGAQESAEPGAENGVVSRAARSLNTLCALLVTAGGLFALTGWILHIEVLTRLNSAFIPTQFNSAVCFTCYGLGLGALNWQWRWIGRALGSVVLLIGLLSWFEHVAAID